MPQSELRLIKNALEYLPKPEIKKVPKKTRGIYVLYHQRKPLSGQRRRFDVVYVGMARRGIAGRLQTHIKSKGDLFTHFSFFEVWNNISDAEIVELEGLFRHLYRFDANAHIGNLPIANISAPELLAVLRRIESRGAIETANRAKQTNRNASGLVSMRDLRFRLRSRAVPLCHCWGSISKKFCVFMNRARFDRITASPGRA